MMETACYVLAPGLSNPPSHDKNQHAWSSGLYREQQGKYRLAVSIYIIYCGCQRGKRRRQDNFGTTGCEEGDTLLLSGAAGRHWNPSSRRKKKQE
jgi:hypothetical protein